ELGVLPHGERAEPVRVGKPRLGHGRRVDREVGDEIQIPHQCGPSGEPVLPRDPQLSDVQREPLGGGPLKRARFFPQVLRRGIIGQGAGNDGLLSYARRP
ncbi:hypothetical protein DKX15_16140, partial [Enterococcus faecium]